MMRTAPKHRHSCIPRQKDGQQHWDLRCWVKTAGENALDMRIAVGTHIAMRPPHKAVRAAFPHTASTSGV
jgi:hypothetical protein